MIFDLFPEESLASESLSPAGVALARGVARLLRDLGYGVLAELPLANGRRADLVGLGRDGSVAIVEVKSSIADYRADRKWTEYRRWCDCFYFAAPASFPTHVLPDDTGLILADPFGASVLREPPRTPLHASRRKALTLRFARTASQRLGRSEDPGAPDPS